MKASDFPHASETFKRLNPHIFGVGAVPATKPEQVGRKPQGDAAGQARSKGGVAKGVRLLARISLTAHRNRELDYDNIVASFKFLQDAIAARLLPWLPPGRADEFFKWEYGQVETRGEEGVVVKIEIL